MRLAVSSIGWPAGADAAAAALLRRLHVDGVELAPTKIWPKPLEATSEEIAACRAFWEGEGLPIIAFQALLFGHPEFDIFGDAAQQTAVLDYLDGIFRLAHGLGARAMVFGSPKNRRRGTLTSTEAFDKAVTFFREAGKRASRHEVILCLEPNPKEYDCDFVNLLMEGHALVAAVDHPGFGLHGDTGQLGMTGEPAATVLPAVVDRLRHFHLSEAFLKPLGSTGVDHAGIHRALKEARYDGWLSIEMGERQFTKPWQEEITAAVLFARQAYHLAAATARHVA